MKNARRCILALLAAVWFSTAALLFVSCGSPRTMMVPPRIPGADFAGNHACADCHPATHDHFGGSPHARIHVDADRLPGGTGCESCHGPASKHIASGGLREFIVNPGREPAACFQCHLNTRGEFRLSHRHPVLEGQMNCADCHDPHGADIIRQAGRLAMGRRDETCAACHREQTRPFVFEHEALREGCVTCHQPHGSINPKMLAVRDSNLCLRCHAQAQAPDAPRGRVFIGAVDHTELMRTGSCWSCHTAVHGSNVDPRLRF